MIDISNNLFEFFHNNGFFNNFLNLFYCLILVFNLDDFLVLFDDLFYLLDYDRNLDDFLDDFLDVTVDVDKLRDYFLYLDDFWDLDDDLFGTLDLVDFWNGDGFFNNFFNDLLSCYDLLDY